MTRRQITDTELVQTGTDFLRDAMYHCVPGIVKAFNAGSAGVPATVDVQPATNDVRFHLETAERQSEPFQLVPNVPIAYPRGGGYCLQFPMRAGDRVVLVAFDLDPTPHRHSGNVEDPGHVIRHGGNAWVAIPCDITDPGALQSGAAAANALVLGVDGGQPQIIINGSAIQFGATGGDKIALATKVNAMGAALKNFAEGIAPPTPIVVPGTTGVPTAIFAALALALANAIVDVGSALLEAQ